MATGLSNFPNRPFRLRTEAWINWQSGAVASIHVQVWVDKMSYSPTWSNSGGSSAVSQVQGVNKAGWGPTNFDFRNGNNFLLIEYDTQTNVNNDGGMWIASFANLDILGYTEHGFGLYGTPLSRPAAPGTPTATNVGTTKMTLLWNIPADGGLPIDQMLLRQSTDPNFSTYTDHVRAAHITSSEITGLNPGTVYYWRVYAHNGLGYSDSSGVRAQATLPATPPGLSVTPNLSGRSAVASLTPPSSASGVSKYRVQRRIGSGSATSEDTTSTSLTVDSLTPGQAYQWRASAFFGDYQSPWTDWVTVTQPNPNTNPGDYFDGASAARGDLTFSWNGTANNSTSNANGVAVNGWTIDSGASGAAMRVQRVTGGRSGTYCARVWYIVGASAAGSGLGMVQGDGTKSAVVEEGAAYVGSIYVRPSRAQRMRAALTWSTAAGVTVGTAIFGEEVLVTDASGWTRLTVSGQAPEGAERAVIKAYDVDGTGWSAWQSGEWWDADDVMVSLGTLFDWFSGDTPDAPGFDYQWLGTPNASPSVRLELEVADYDPLADPDCPPVPAPPAVPTVPSDCIDEVGTWRRYAIQVPASAVREWSASLPTLVLTTDGSAERQVRIRYYSAPEGVTPEALDAAAWEAEQILTYIPPNTEVTLDGVTQLVWASVAGAPQISADRLLYGTGGMPATWPELTCGDAYIITLDVPLDAPAGNLSTRLLITQRM